MKLDYKTMHPRWKRILIKLHKQLHGSGVPETVSDVKCIVENIDKWKLEHIMKIEPRLYAFMVECDKE